MSIRKNGVTKFLCHSKTLLDIAQRYGWLPGARYTNLRDVRHVERLGFLDIDWEDYRFHLHIKAASATRPFMTVAQDVERASDLNRILDQAELLNEHADQVVIVPKDESLSENLSARIPSKFILGYSVPTRYGGTRVAVQSFAGRPVHLLGGRPDVQRQIAKYLWVVSVDGNRFTLDAKFGDYFDGKGFRPHPLGGYQRCVEDSIQNINKLWECYRPVLAVKSNGENYARA